ncbi:MAG: glycine cleavage system protein H [Pseudobdellovibrionaceae bacterium]
MEENVRNYMGYLWMLNEDGVVTIGINDEGLEDLDEIIAIDLPQENEKFDDEEVCGSIDTNDGPLDLYSPGEGKVVEVNAAVVEDMSLIKEDNYGEGWLVRFEIDADADDDEDEDDDDDNRDEDEEDEDED